jgi:hypothetical protein
MHGMESDEHRVLRPPDWRQVLREELIANGCRQDTAGMIARRVVERLVLGYLSGRLEPAPPATQSLDEAA